MPKLKRKSVTLTPAEKIIAERMAEADAAQSFSQWIRSLIADECARRGIEWPDAPVRWGGSREPNDTPEN